MKNHVLIILLAVLTMSCDSNEDTIQMATIESALIFKNNLFGNGDEGIVQQKTVIDDQTTWNDLIAQMNSVNNVSDDFSEIDIDFSAYTIIAIFDEIQSNGGHVLDVEIMANSENIMVSVTDLAPEGDGTDVITQPFHIVKITKSNLPIVFE